MNQALLLALVPLFALVLVIGLVVYLARRGRPVQLKLKGLGIQFELTGSASPQPISYKEE